MKRDPNNKSAHASLVEAMGGKMPDWYVSSHHELIDFYKEFVQQNPNICRGYMWLMDHLLDACRFEEAKTYLEKFEEIDNTFRTYMYRILIAFYSGKKEDAYHQLAEMEAAFPHDDGALLCAGDLMARCGDYEKAKTYYRRGMEVQEPPRFCDYLESIAQVCELQGDILGALAAFREELDVQREEWNITTGETTDIVRRNIARLEKML